jgi:hypothetical protein
MLVRLPKNEEPSSPVQAQTCQQQPTMAEAQVSVTDLRRQIIGKQPREAIGWDICTDHLSLDR